MVAICQADEFHATAFAKSFAGTRFATSEDDAGMKNARAVPKTAKTMKICAGEVSPRSVRSRSASAQKASTQIEMHMISRRPKRSEAAPVTSTSNRAGAN